jgi:hypothetical protein
MMMSPKLWLRGSFRNARAHWLQTAEKQWRVATWKLTDKRFGGDSVLYHICSSCPFRNERAHWLQTAEKQWRVAMKKLPHIQLAGFMSRVQFAVSSNHQRKDLAGVSIESVEMRAIVAAPHSDGTVA